MQSGLGSSLPKHSEEHFESPKSLQDNQEHWESPNSSKRKRKRSLHPDEVHVENKDQYTGSPSNQLLLYDRGQNDDIAASKCTEKHIPKFKNFLGVKPSNCTSPSIGAFTVQCATCLKWRLIPTKEKYEEIREHILEKPFLCEHAREWSPNISCDDPTDISQDGSRVWAIDKPNIAQPPPGWERILRIRGEGGTKFADVYYTSPTGKRLRSMIEIQRYLLEHPVYVREGVNLSQFSFQIPRPLQENYVRRRPARLSSSSDGGDLGLPMLPEPEEDGLSLNTLSWAAPHTRRDLQDGVSDSAVYCYKARDHRLPSHILQKPESNRNETMLSSDQLYKRSMYNQPSVELDED